MPTVDEATQNFINNLHEKTGVPLAQWVEIALASGKSKHGEIVSYLKSEKGLTHGYANLIALHTKDPNRGTSSDDEKIAEMYSGAKQALRPIYDELVTTIKSFGEDIEISPKKGYVSIRHKRQFLTIEPKSKSVVIGINLGTNRGSTVLDRVSNPGMMPSHKLVATSVSDITEEVIHELKAAYDTN